MGIVLLTGLSIGTLFTLFVVPAVYVFIGADHAHDNRASTLTVGGKSGGPGEPAANPS
jgi:multidrug efflux pump